MCACVCARARICVLVSAFVCVCMYICLFVGFISDRWKTRRSLKQHEQYSSENLTQQREFVYAFACVDMCACVCMHVHARLGERFFYFMKSQGNDTTGRTYVLVSCTNPFHLKKFPRYVLKVYLLPSIAGKLKMKRRSRFAAFCDYCSTLQTTFRAVNRQNCKKRVTFCPGITRGGNIDNIINSRRLVFNVL